MIKNTKHQKPKINNFRKVFKSTLNSGSLALKADGFTLVELLIVIAIIGILLSFLSISFFGVRQRTQDAQRKSDIQKIQSSLEQFRSDNDSYMTDSEYNAIACGSEFEGTAGVVYSQTTPCDPDDPTKKYFYHSYNDGFSYVMVACLENTDDSGGYTLASPPDFFEDSGATWPGITCDSEYYYVARNP